MVRVVLDTTALLAYSQLRGMAAAELVAMVEEEGGAALVGIPAACFQAAYPQLQDDERARLTELATKVEGVTVILPLVGGDTVEVAVLDDRLPGGKQIGHAIVEAQRRGAHLATYAASQALQELPPDSVLDLAE
ncbi:MAG TPA: hypothetical protein DGG94_10745 [Micromonosporaceae bacterium]|nr:hypothetical protein [Micromonosporaceae bacterium]HCU50256.1 hypothetical protein [Micromonosporaceae bacterium]